MFSNNGIYQKSLDIFSNGVEWEKLKNKRILIIGAAGLIGTFMIDLLMYINHKEGLHISIIACGRNEKKLEERFSDYIGDSCFSTFIADINKPFTLDEDVDYIFHLASNTHPLAYSEKPVETLMTNVEGTYNLLTYAKDHLKDRFMFLSSVEIYGQPYKAEPIKETDCGYIDCNTARACYNEGKRAGESLCQAFIKQYDLDIVIPRLCRVYGPTMKLDDSKALSQFIKKGLLSEDIVLKSKGEQYFSYLYVGDVVNALLFLLLNGEKGSAYNISDKGSDIKLKDLANIIAEWACKSVIFDFPDEKEAAGYSKAGYAVLENDKIQNAGWHAQYNLKQGINETLNVLNFELN